MNETLRQWQKNIDNLDQRERILLMVTALVAVVMVLQLLLIDPLLADRKKIQAGLQQTAQKLQQQENEQQILTAQLAVGINRHKMKKRDALVVEVDALNQRIERSVKAMIPPRLMPEVLESILVNNTGLKLLSLENRSVIPLLEDSDSAVKNKTAAAVKEFSVSKQGLYKHSFVLRLSGSYMSTIGYFEQLSNLPWRFYWDDLHYQVDNYPDATITLEVHTVSMSEEWIGV